MKCEHCEGTGKRLDNKAIGEQMEKIRLKAKMTTRNMAEAIELSHSYIWLLENGRRNWRPSLVKKYMAAAFIWESMSTKNKTP